MAKMARIYVSSTFKDLEECRDKVRLSLRQMGHEDIGYFYPMPRVNMFYPYVEQEKRPLAMCLKNVVCCDLYIGIFAWRYGSVPAGYDKSVTELEYRKAVEAGKKCLIFLLDEDVSWPLKFMDIGINAEKIGALRDELSKSYVVNIFKSSDELPGLVSAAVHNWEIENIIKTQKDHFNSSNFEYDIAISYASENRKIITTIAKKLVENNIRVFYDEYEKTKLWGKNLSMHFQQVYGEKSCFVLVFVSKEYSMKDWTNFEFTIARDAAKTKKTEFILPVRLDNTPLVGLHRDIAYLDLANEGIEGIVNAVVNKINDLHRF